MYQNSASSTPRRSVIVSVLIYIGIIWGVNFVDSLVYNAVYRGLSSVTVSLPFHLSSMVYFLFSIANTIVICIATGLLFRQLVFRSKKSPVAAIVLLCVLNVVRSFVVSFAYTLVIELLYDSMDSSFYHPVYQVVSFVLTWGVHALCFVLQYRIYNDGSASNAHSDKVLSTANTPDPAIVTVDLEAIEKRSDAEERSRIFRPDAADDTRPRRSSFGLFNRFDTENDSERVIAQSSRDAIRVMEHKDLNMAHEWNCEERGKAQPQQSASRHVIAPGSGNPVHVTEHSALDMKHEWNCDDRKLR